MLKVGDKLLCKKDRLLSQYKLNKLKGEYYSITGIDVYFVYFDGIGDWYNLNSNSVCYIGNYFYTPQELRKMKLKQLKQC